MDHNILELTKKIEKQIRVSIKGNSAHEWDENFITLRLLQDLRLNLSNIQLLGKDYSKKINWEIYKLRGKAETNYGDISLVVNIHYKDGTHLEGAAFLEAKRRDWRKTTFSAMNSLQLNRILKYAPRAQYLLYDYQDITDFLNPILFREADYEPYRLPYEYSITTRALCVPLTIAKQTGYKDTLLYRYGTPLSLMLTSRYFQGLDLEFDKKSLSIAKGFLKAFKLPQFILKIEIFEEGAKEVDARRQDINYEEYVAID